MSELLVLGIGNRLMMDDGIGVAVVEELASLGDEGIRYLVGETDFGYCLEVASEAERLLIIDAALTGAGPGTVSLLPLPEMARCRPGLSLHQLQFVDLLLQEGAPARGALIGIEPYRIEFHLGLSEPMQAELEEIIERVRAIIQAWR